MKCPRCNAEKSFEHVDGAFHYVVCRKCGFAWMPSNPKKVVEKSLRAKAVPA